jgi:outer membrane protein assembly factor BamB
MSVIELGVVTRDDDEPPAAPVRHLFDRPGRRRALVAIVTAVCVLTVTGSSRPDPGGLPQLWSVPYEPDSGTFTLTADSVYVLSPLGESSITAHDLQTGAVRWSRPSPPEVNWLSGVQSGTLLLPAGMTTSEHVDEAGSTVYRQIQRETIALDAATGRQLWRKPGELVTIAGDRVLLTEWNKAGDEITTFRTVRLRDGGTLWSRPAGNAETWTTDFVPGAVPDRLVTVTAQGRAEVLSLADGRTLATRTIPWLPQSRDMVEEDEDHTSVSMEGGQLYLDHLVSGRSTVTAYDAATLQQLWQIKQQTVGGAFGCGPLLCLSTGTETTGHDRRTGEVRWQIPGAINIVPLRNGLLMVLDDETGAGHHLMDAVTGRRVADLGTAMPVWHYWGNAMPYLVAQAAPPADFSLLSWVDERTGEVLLRGRIPTVLEHGCQSNGTVVACMTQDNRLIVTDVG